MKGDESNRRLETEQKNTQQRISLKEKAAVQQSKRFYVFRKQKLRNDSLPDKQNAPRAGKQLYKVPRGREALSNLVCI